MLDKKVFVRFITLILLLLIPQFLFSQSETKPRISIFPLENKDKDLQVEVISRNVQKTIELNLKMIDRYIIVDNTVTEYSSDPSWLLKYCEQNNIDDLIFGRSVMRSNSSIFIEMSVFNRKKAAITLTKSETAGTVFEIFGAADKLAVEMMNSFSGMHLGFGELKFINNGDKGRYSVYIDNLFAGENLANFPKVLYGNRSVKITQARMFENSTIYENTVVVTENKTTEVLFSIPGFLEKESSAVLKEETYIDKNWEKKNSIKNIDKRFDKLFTLLETVSYSQTAVDKKKEIENKFENWDAQKEYLAKTSDQSVLDKTLGVAVFGGAVLMYPSYEESGVDGWKPEVNFAPKAGISLSVNIPFNFALQAEVSYMNAAADYTNDNLDLAKGADMELIEIPVLLMYRLPRKVISIYGGGVCQFKIDGAEYAYTTASGYDYEDETVPLKTFGMAMAFGALFEIPIKSSFISVDLRYVRSMTNWVDYDDNRITLYPDYFHLTVGWGLKFF